VHDRPAQRADGPPALVFAQSLLPRAVRARDDDARRLRALEHVHHARAGEHGDDEAGDPGKRRLEVERASEKQARLRQKGGAAFPGVQLLVGDAVLPGRRRDRDALLLRPCATQRAARLRF
jgi:hypothetical protein